jgi:hypothetical protein
VSRVTSQWEALPRHRGGGEERSVDWPVTVAAAALVTSLLVGEGAACIAQICHTVYIQYIYIYIYCDMDGATGGGGRVSSVDSRGDVTSASHRCVTTLVNTISRQR